LSQKENGAFNECILMKTNSGNMQRWRQHNSVCDTCTKTTYKQREV